MGIIQLKLSSRELQTKTDVVVLLPGPPLLMEYGEVDYSFFDDNKKYQVLYLYHGTTGDCFDWLRFSRLNSYAQEHRLAVVLPSVQNSSFHNIPNSYAYYNYVVKELPTIMNWMFPFSRKRQDNFVAGLSMGGTGTFKIAMTSPEKFGYAACLSAGFHISRMVESDRTCLHAAAFGAGESLTGTADDPYWLAEEVVRNKVDYPRLYICCGTEDPIVYDSNVKFKNYLDSIGMKYTYHEQPGGHDWDFWDDELKRVMSWLPLANDLVYG